jgi:threonine/homoserine/homoserine lactone efflux protein
VIETALRIVLYGLIAGASPLALLATLAILGSRRGRANGSLFGAGFLLGQSAAFLVAYFVGSAVTAGREGGYETLAGSVQVAVGALLLAFAWRARRLPETKERAGESRTKALLGRLGRVKPATSFSFGALLGVGGVKRLTITVLAGTTIAAAGLSPVEEVGLSVVYVLIASVLVWFPVGVYLLVGKRADDWMASAEEWLATHERRLTVALTFVFGVLLVGDGLIRLL